MIFLGEDLLDQCLGTLTHTNRRNFMLDYIAECEHLYFVKQEKLLQLCESKNLDWDDLSSFEMKCLERELDEIIESRYEP